MLQQVDSAIAFTTVMLILSLIITALVQILLSLLDLRGLNLVWALSRLFHQADPSLRAVISDKEWYELFRPTVGRRLAQAVSKYKPLVSGVTGRAQAIRSGELLQVLRQMAKTPPAGMPTEVADALKRLVSERVPGGESGVEQAEVLVNSLTATMDPTLKAQLGTRLTDAVHNAVGTVSKMELQVDQWFDTVMDRSSEIFAAHSKVYTFAFAALLAFGWHIDSGQIYRQISTNSDVRDSLNRAADSVMAQGDKLVQSQHVTATFNQFSRNSSDLAATVQDTSTIRCDDGKDWMTANSEKLPPYEVDLQKAITQACSANKDKPDFSTALKPVVDKASSLATAWSKAPTTFERCSQGVRWLQSPEASFPGFDAVGQFQKECVLKAQKSLGEAGDSIASLRTTLEGSKLQISTTSLQSASGEIAIKPFSLTGYGYWQHLVGTLATVLLLSLGAPFWFNTLRQLSSLKPEVAQKMESENGDDETG